MISTITKPQKIESIEERNLEPLNVDISELFIKSFRKLKPLVKKVLKSNPATRNNDNLLVLCSWREEYDDFKVTIGRTKEIDGVLVKNLVIDFPVDMISMLRSAESITRARRSLTSQAYKKALKTGDYSEFKQLIPTDERVIQIRKLREQALYEFFSRENKQWNVGYVN